MMKNKKFWFLILSVVAVACICAGLYACKNDGGEIAVRKDIRTYILGDSVYVYDLFELSDGGKYSFAYKYDAEGEEEKQIGGESFYVAKTGKYIVTANETGKDFSGKAEVTVVDESPVFNLKYTTAEVKLFSRWLPIAIINKLAVPTILSKGVHNEYVSQVAVYKNGKNALPTVYPIENAEKSDDGFYDGKFLNFIYECSCVATIVCDTSGGKSYKDLEIVVKEDVSQLQLLDKKIEYDENTRTVTWESVEEAEYYRVKFDGVTLEKTELSVSINEEFGGEFHYSDFIVIPVAKSGEFMGKIVREKIHIYPEGSEGIVLGNGVKSIDSATKTVELVGTQSVSPSFTSGTSKMTNSYIAFAGDYGTGTIAEFTFKGNNLPNLCFFADEINGNMTNLGGSGFLLMNGLYATNDIQQSTSTSFVVGENVLLCIGPDRIDRNEPYSVGNYIALAQARSKAYTVSEDSLFGQKKLREDVSERTYKYTVITYEDNGNVAFQVSLADTATGRAVEKTVNYVTKTSADDVKGLNVIAFASVKGKNDNTVFSYSVPRKCPQYMMPTVDYSLNAGSGENKGSLDSDSAVSRYENDYAYMGDYETNSTFFTEFTGDNMPQIKLFASEESKNMGAGKGYVITNGISVAGSSAKRADYLYAWSAEELSAGISSATESNFVFETGKEYKGLNDGETYFYYLGSKVVSDKVIITVKIYSHKTKSIIVKGEFDTGSSQSETEAFGKKVLFYAGIKGGDVPTVFKYYGPSSVVTADEGGGTKVDLGAGKPFGENGIAYSGRFGSTGNLSGASDYVNNFISLGEYGVGYEFTATFYGSNVPQIMLFSDEAENGSLGNGGTSAGTNPPTTYAGGKGYLITNGICSLTNVNGNSLIMANFLYVFGPNRISFNFGKETATNFTTIKGEPFDNNLDMNTQYKYAAGTYEKDGTVVIYAELSEAKSGKVLYYGEYSTGQSVFVTEMAGKYVLMHAGVKGNKVRTEFTYYTPELKHPVQTKEGYTVTENADGSKSYVIYPGDDTYGYADSNGTIGGPGALSDLATYVNNYVDLGEYGVGYKFITRFSGNNLPWLMLFADGNDLWSLSRGVSGKDDNKGYLISNGLLYRNWNNPQTAISAAGRELTVFGPDRIWLNLKTELSQCGNVRFKNAEGIHPIAENLTDEVNYRYEVSTWETSGSVVIRAELYDDDSGERIFIGDYDTGKTKAEIESIGKRVVIHANVKGTDNDTVFTLYKPENLLKDGGVIKDEWRDYNSDKKLY